MIIYNIIKNIDVNSLYNIIGTLTGITLLIIGLKENIKNHLNIKKTIIQKATYKQEEFRNKELEKINKKYEE